MSGRTRPSLYPPERVRRSSPTHPDGGFRTIDHPRYAEPIHEHAEQSGPEGLFEGHHDLPIGRQCIEYALGFLRVIELDRYGEALRFLVAVRWSIRSHQYVGAHNHSRMKDFVAPLRRHVLLGRR